MKYDSQYLNATGAFNYLGISKALFYRLIKTDSTFPKGMEITKGKKIYDKRSLDKWLIAKNAVNQH